MIRRCLFRRDHCRGGILLEVLLSIALFVGAGAFALAATRNVFRNLERTEREQLAADLARSKMAELEAGMIALADLRGASLQQVGSMDWSSEEILDRAYGGRRSWIVDVQTERTAHGNLSLVELTVREVTEAEDAASFTLHQLVALREVDPEAYAPDELVEGLPDVPMNSDDGNAREDGR